MVKKFELDPAEFAQNREPIDARFPGEARPTEFLEDIELKENPLLEQVGDVASRMLSGEIPPDVQEEIERITAEQSLQTGLGIGQGARNLTARDLGLTSFDIQQRGIAAGLDVAGQQTQRDLAEQQLNLSADQFNEQINLEVAKFQQHQREWEDRFTLMMQESDISASQLDLMAADLISTNQRFMQNLIGQMVIQNSVTEIQGLQDNVNQLDEFFNTTNTGIAQLLDLELGG